MPVIIVFVQLEFVSFNEDDLDYKGYEYSVTGKISEVRVVFLNRFVQEVNTSFSIPKFTFLRCSLHRLSWLLKYFEVLKIRKFSDQATACSLVVCFIVADNCLLYGSHSTKFRLCNEAEGSRLQL